MALDDDEPDEGEPDDDSDRCPECGARVEDEHESDCSYYGDEDDDGDLDDDEDEQAFA